MRISDWSSDVCSSDLADLCAINIVADDRNWRVLATRSGYMLPWRVLTAQCRQADIVISDRRLPRSCTPRWLKLDRRFLERNGGLSVNLAHQRGESVIKNGDQKPDRKRTRMNSSQ